MFRFSGFLIWNHIKYFLDSNFFEQKIKYTFDSFLPMYYLNTELISSDLRNNIFHKTPTICPLYPVNLRFLNFRSQIYSKLNYDYSII